MKPFISNKNLAGVVISLLIGFNCINVYPTATDTTKWYVRTTGSDVNEGHMPGASSALLTISKAAQLAKPGDIVYVAPGMYSEMATPAMSGTVSKPITFLADTNANYFPPDLGGNVIISGQNYGFDLTDKSNIIIQGFTFASQFFSPIQISATTSDVTGLVIKGCKFSQWYTSNFDSIAINISSSLSYNVSGLIIDSCRFENYTGRGARVLYLAGGSTTHMNDSFIIANNVFSMNTAVNSECIVFNGYNSNHKIYKNRFYHFQKGVFFNGDSANYISIYNNFFYAPVNSFAYGIVNLKTQFHDNKILYNTFNTSNACIMGYPDNVILVNNILLSNSMCLFFNGDNTNKLKECNYNLYFTYGTDLFYYNSIAYSSLASFQVVNHSLTGDDFNSINADPQLVAANNIALINTSPAAGAGKPVTNAIYGTTISNDLDGTFRNATAPTIGAYEVVLPLSGSYDIGGGNNDFPDYSSAVNSLVNGGVGANTIFNVYPGTYNEQITIPHIVGTSGENKITFRSVTGDSTDVILTYTATSAKNYTILFDGADYVTFQQMTIQAANPDYYTMAVKFQNGATYDNLLNNRITGSCNTCYSIDQTLVYSNSSFGLCSNLEISNNFFSKGYHSVDINGNNNTNRSGSNIIKNNTFIDFSRAAIHVQYVDSSSIESNIISTHSAYGDVRGIILEYCSVGNLVTKNKIYSQNSGIGIHINGYYSDDGGQVVISNNLITLDTGQCPENVYGIRLDDVSPFAGLVSNNTIFILSKCAGSGVYVAYSSYIDIENNIFANYGGGYAIDLEGNASYITSNYNDYYSNGPYMGYYAETDVYDITGWKSWQTTDINSISVPPAFLNDTNLIPQNCSLDNSGILLVSEDYTGNLRNDPPDMGAFEFSSSPYSGTIYIGMNHSLKKLSDAFRVLNACGISGPVNIKLTDTLYQDQSFVIDAIPGLSEANPIIVEPDIAAKITYKINCPATLFYGISIGAISYLTIDGLLNKIEFQVQGAEGQQISVMLFQAQTSNQEHITIRNCIITGTNNLTAGTGLTFTSSSPNVQKYLLIENNLFRLSNTGISLGTGPNYGKHNIIRNNIIQGDTTTLSHMRLGIVASYQDSIEISGNTISGIFGMYSDESQLCGISLSNITNSRISKNYIHDIIYTYNGGTSTYGLYLTTGNSDPNITIDNNVIKHITQYGSGIGSSSPIGIYLDASSASGGIGSIRLYYNTIFLSHDPNWGLSASNSMAIGIYITSNLNKYDIRNNNVDIRLGKRIGGVAEGTYAYAIYKATNDTSNTFAAIDYNNYYINGEGNSINSIGYRSPSIYTTLADWKTATLKDQHSITVKPLYNDNTSIHLSKYNVMLNNKGTPISSVTEDIDNESRDLTNPDIGADEFAGVPVLSRHITTNSTWQDTVYITDSTWIDNNVKVQVLPGTVIMFFGESPLTVNGCLQSEGTSANQIKFTSFDTTGLAAMTYTGWSIDFINTSATNDSSVFNHCLFEYGGGINRLLGGALQVKNFNKIAVSNSQFLYNQAENGGAIFADSSSFTIQGSMFSNNYAPTGGAIYQNAGRIYYINNIICNNEAQNGGGLFIMADDTSYIINNTIVNNYAKYISNPANGGGVQFLDGANTQVYNSIFYGNKATTDGDQVAVGVFVYSPSLFYNDIQGGSVTLGSGHVDFFIGNIDTLPEFINPSAGYGKQYKGYLANWRLANTSGCINAGKPDFTTDSVRSNIDMAGNYRIFRDTIDIGAYEDQTPYGTVAISAHPDTVETCQGNNITFTVSCTTAGTSHQWQNSTDGVNYFDIPAANDSVYDINNVQPNISGNRYRCIVSKLSYITDTTNTALLTVNAMPIVDAGVDFSACTRDTVSVGTINTMNYASLSWTTEGIGTFSNLNVLQPDYGISSESLSSINLVLTAIGVGNCPNIRDTVIITVKPRPVITGTTPDSRCDTGIITLAASSDMGTIDWYTSASGGTSLGTGNSFVTPSISSTTPYYAEASYDGCITESRNAVTATVNSLPTVIATSNSPVCEGTTVNLSETGGSATSWSWSGPNGFTSSLQNPTIANITSADSGTYSVTASNGTCSNISSTIVTINSLPIINIGSNSPVCESATLNLTETGGSTITWNWIGPNGFNSDLQNPSIANITSADSGTYTVTAYSATCVNVSSIVVTVNALQNVNINISASANPVCAGTSVTFTATPANGGASPLYQWKLHGTDVAGATNSTYTYTPANDDSVTCVLTSDLSCASGNPAESNAVIMIVDNTLPAGVSLSASSNPVCNGSSVTFTATPTNGGTTPIYRWYVNGIEVAGGTGIYYNYFPINGDTVICEITSDLTCTSGNPATSSPIIITVNSLPVVSVSPSDTTIITGNSVVLIASGASSYFWTTGANSVSVAIAPNKDTTLTVTGTTNGCSSDASALIHVKPLPCVADFNFSISGMDVTFTDLSTSATDWNWSFGNGDYSSEQSPVYVFNKSGKYEVCLTILNPGTNCITSICKQVEVGTADPYFIDAQYVYTIQGDGKTVDFTDSSSTNITNRYWLFGDGTFSTDTNPKHYFKKAGNFKVCLKVYNSNRGTIDQECKTITIGEPACNLIAGFNYVVSASRNVTFSNTSAGIADKFYWNFGDDFTSSSANPEHTFSNPGYYLVSLSVRDSISGCNDFVAQLIKVGVVNCKADFDFTVDTATNTVSFKNNSKGTPKDFFWLFGNRGYSTQENPTFNFKKGGLYNVSLTITDVSGTCVDNVEKQVQVNEITCSAAFTYYIDSGTHTGYFTNQEIGDSSQLFWLFGDGSVSGSANPVHTFKADGYYSVKLTVYNSGTECMAHSEATIMVGSPGKDCQSDFLYYLADAGSRTVKFIDNSNGNISKWIWNFDDRTKPLFDVTNPSHTFNKPGFYNVCLTVTDNRGVTNITCKPVSVEADELNNCKADFIYMIDTASLTVTFANNSVGTIESYNWDFGDGQISTLPEPSVTYDTAGFYLVKLKVSNTSKKCSDMRIALLNMKKADEYRVSFGFNALNFNAKAGGYPVDFIGAGCGDQSRLQWSFGEEGNDTTNVDTTSNSPTHVYNDPGKYWVCLTYTDPVSEKSAIQCDSVSTAEMCQGDTIDPDAKCKDRIVTLDVNGTKTIAASEIDNGSTDDCAINIYSLDNSTFTQANIGSNTVHLTVTDYMGNSKTCTATVIVQNGDYIRSGSLVSNFKVYPNPFDNKLYIAYDLIESSQVELAIYDLVGKHVLTLSSEKLVAGAVKRTFDASGLQSGSYILQIKTSKGLVREEMIVKR